MTEPSHPVAGRRATLQAWIPSLAGGIVAGAISVALGVSMAALVFHGDLAPSLPLGVGLTLFGSGLVSLITALRSSFPFALSGVQDAPSAILAVAMGAIAARVSSDLEATALAVVVVASASMGLTLYLVGRLRLGGLARYIPFPVVGGFLLATGLLILSGATDILFHGRSASQMLTFDAFMLWGPGVAVGVVVYAAGRFGRATLATPIALLVATAILRLGFAVGGVGRDAAQARGWLLGPFPGDVTWTPTTMRMLGDAEWGVVGSAWLEFASIALVAVISLVLYVHALEHVAGRDVDVNRELRIAGIASVASSAGGGLPGYLYFSDSVLLLRFAGGHRAAAILASLVPLVVVAFGTSVLGMLPVAVIVGVLIALGLGFVIEWLWDARHRLGRIEHALVVLIGATVVLVGFLAAIGLGLVIAVGLFVVRYSRVDVVRRTSSLAAMSSSLDRPEYQRDVLAEHGDRVRIIEVRGFLFFGTATGAFDNQRLTPSRADRGFHAVLFDLSGVTGIDSSTIMALQRLDRTAQSLELTVVFAGLPHRLRTIIAPAIADAKARVLEFADLDDALRWCENDLLDRVLGAHEPPDHVDFSVHLTRVLESREAASAVMRHAKTIEVTRGSLVIRNGEPAPGLFFLATGMLSVIIPGPDGTRLRLRQMLPGTVIGEMSLYRGGAATADVVADDDCLLWHVDITDIARLDREDPASAAAVHRFAASVLAERVAYANERARSS